MYDKIRVRSWSKNANIQLIMAQNTHQFVLSPLCQKLVEENDKKYQLLDIQNIISLLLLHIKYFYCRLEFMVWRNLLKIYVLQSWSAASNALESGEIFRREATWREWCQPGSPLEETMGLLPFPSVHLLPGCVEMKSFLCWMLPSRCSALFQKWRQQEKPAWDKTLRTWVKINFSSLMLFILDVL